MELLNHNAVGGIYSQKRNITLRKFQRGYLIATYSFRREDMSEMSEKKST